MSLRPSATKFAHCTADPTHPTDNARLNTV